MTQDICCAVPGWLCDVLVAGEEMMWRMNCNTTIRLNHAFMAWKVGAFGVGYEAIYTLMLKGRGGREFGLMMDVGDGCRCRHLAGMQRRMYEYSYRASYLPSPGKYHKYQGLPTKASGKQEKIRLSWRRESCLRTGQ